MSEKKHAIDPDLVRELAGILSDSGLAEIEVEHGELKLKLSRAAPAQPLVAYAPQAQAYAPQLAPAPAQNLAPAMEAPRGADWRSHPGAVLSPMVGAAYLSPEPGAAAFVKVGDQVSEGQTLMIVEAMKTFNPIPAPRSGKVAQIIIAGAQPVEFGEPLLVLE